MPRAIGQAQNALTDNEEPLVTTLQLIALTCPNCACTFSTERVDLDDIKGRSTTDLRAELYTSNALSRGVHMCERCGYAGPEESFDEGEVSFDVRRRVWDEITPILSTHDVTASEKYEFAARVAAWNGARPRELADLWLRAAWCCVDEGDTEAERYYRRHAVWAFQEALNTYDGVAVEERPRVTYLIGELWRRIGDTALANDWFDLVPDEVTDRAQQSWLVRAARQQRDDPCEWFV